MEVVLASVRVARERVNASSENLHVVQASCENDVRQSLQRVQEGNGRVKEKLT